MVMAARPNRRVARVGRRAGDRRRLPGWVTLAAGLVVGGVAVWAAFFVRERVRGAAPPPAAESQPRPSPRQGARAASVPPEKRYGFYDMLPNFEVVVPEEDKNVRRDTNPAPLEVPGVYVLQAGSYGSFAEADRVKAQLALLGVKSQIQKIRVDDREYNRVRIGPIEDLSELNRVRKRLREAKIDALVIRVGE